MSSTTKKRRLDPEMWDDLPLGIASHEAQLLFVKLITQADDEGRLRGNVGWLKSKCYPHEHDLAAGEVESWLDELDRVGLIQRYAHADQPYIYLPGWRNTQWVDSRYFKPSKLPRPPAREGPGGDPGGSQEQPTGATGAAPGKPTSKGSEVEVEKKSEAPAKAGASDVASEEGEENPEERKRSKVPTGGRLSDLLADLVAANDPDGKRPTVTGRWLDAERLLIERDGRDPKKVEALIRWVQADDFERANVLSMPKLRERYPSLAQKARREWKAKRGAQGESGKDRLPGERKAA